MSIQGEIEARLREELEPEHLEVVNESHMHSRPGTETHFRVTVVSPLFEGKPLLARHRLVNRALAGIVGNSIHAMALHVPTPGEWEGTGTVRRSPPCAGR